MENKNLTIFITGATDGIGKLVAESLAKSQAKVLIHGRNPNKIEQTINDMKESTGNSNIAGYQADLASFAEVRNMAKQITENHKSIDVLINNAAMAGSEQRKITSDGLEVCFQVNYIATVLLTTLLLPKISRPGRIINVSSMGQYHIDFADVMLEKNYDNIRAYRQSKLAMIMYSIDLAERLKNEGIDVNVIHPGSMLNTKIAQTMFGTSRGNAEDGIAPIIELVNKPHGVTGLFFNGKNEAQALPQAYDLESRRKLWQLSHELIKV